MAIKNHGIGISIKKEDSNFHISIINTGYGCEYHINIYDEKTNRYYTDAFLEFVINDVEIIKQFILYIAICNYAQLDADDFYFFIVNYIKSFSENKSAVKHDESYYVNQQLSGSCTYRSIYLCFYYELLNKKNTLDDIKMFEYKLKLTSINYFIDSIKHIWNKEY